MYRILHYPSFYNNRLCKEHFKYFQNIEMEELKVFWKYYQFFKLHNIRSPLFHSEESMRLPSFGGGNLSSQYFQMSLQTKTKDISLFSLHRYYCFIHSFFLPSSGISLWGWTDWALILPPTLGAALLCSSWAGSDTWLDP